MRAGSRALGKDAHGRSHRPEARTSSTGRPPRCRAQAVRARVPNDTRTSRKPPPMANPSSAARGRLCREANASARASSRQLVTINGRKMPSAACRAGNHAASASSTAVTSAAISSTNTAMRISAGKCPADQRCGARCSPSAPASVARPRPEPARQRRADREQRAQAEQLHEPGILVAKSGTEDVGWGHGRIVPARSSSSSRWRSK